MNKQAALEKLLADMRGDTSLPLLREANLVFGEGDPSAKVMFIGEAPGHHEDVERRPFVGRGGKLLRECIGLIGWEEKEVYITNIVKRRPPENRDPLPEEIAAYAPYLAQQIEIIAPRVIIPLGRFAMNYFISDATITKDQGKIFRTSHYCVVPMLHPAAALRGTGAMNAFRETFQKLPMIVKKCESLADMPLTRRAGGKGVSRDAQAKLF